MGLGDLAVVYPKIQKRITKLETKLEEMKASFCHLGQISHDKLASINALQAQLNAAKFAAQRISARFNCGPPTVRRVVLTPEDKSTAEQMCASEVDITPTTKMFSPDAVALRDVTDRMNQAKPILQIDAKNTSNRD